jgi:hypothetical protein
MIVSQALDDESLLWRTRRIVARAKASPVMNGGSKRARIAEAELRELVTQLKTRARTLNAELQAGARRQDAMTAYRRCLNLGRRYRQA